MMAGKSPSIVKMVINFFLLKYIFIENAETLNFLKKKISFLFNNFRSNSRFLIKKIYLLSVVKEQTL